MAYVCPLVVFFLRLASPTEENTTIRRNSVKNMSTYFSDGHWLSRSVWGKYCSFICLRSRRLDHCLEKQP